MTNQSRNGPLPLLDAARTMTFVGDRRTRDAIADYVLAHGGSQSAAVRALVELGRCQSSSALLPVADDLDTVRADDAACDA